MSARTRRSTSLTGLTDPILYSFRRCPYAIRARLALAVTRTRYELREVQLRAKPASMLAISPKGTVPVLLLPDGEVIDESLDIMRWALMRCDPEGWLERDNAALLAVNDGSFKQDLDGYKYPARHADDALVHRERGLEFLRMLDARLSPNGHLEGSRRGFIDAAIMPFVRQFAAVDREWFDELALPHLQRWLAGHLESNLFQSVMVRRGVWSPSDTPFIQFH
jgi:glutathione S-transferase